MSAQALLSMIAPAVPSAPQGSSGEAASGFQSLLATLMSAAGAPTETSADATSADLSIAPDKTNEAVVAAGFLIAPPPPPAPPAVALATGVSAEADGAQVELAPAAPATAAAPSMSAAATAATAPLAPTAPAGSAGSANSDAPNAAASARVEAGEVPPADRDGIAPVKAGTPTDTASTPALQSTTPPVTPQSVTNGEPASRAAEAQPLRPAPEPAGQTPAATLPPPVQAGAGEAVEAAQAQAHTRAAAPPTPLPPTPPVTATPVIPTGAPTPAAAAAPPLMPTPAPLRALAERTSKPLEGAATTASSSAAPGDARPVTGAVTAPTLATTPDQPAKATDAAPTAIPDTTAEADESLAEMARPAEGAAAETHAGAAVRDLSLSTLSRATIDATAQIAAQILRKLEGRSTRFEMALTPDDLGRVDVRLDIDAEGRLAARLAFDNPAAATDLRGRVDDLRRQLEDAGFHLADDAFEFAERDSGSSAFDRGQDGRDGHKRAFAAAARLNTEIDVAQPPRWMALSLSPSGVDLKV